MQDLDLLHGGELPVEDRPPAHGSGSVQAGSAASARRAILRRQGKRWRGSHDAAAKGDGRQSCYQNHGEHMVRRGVVVAGWKWERARAQLCGLELEPRLARSAGC